MKMDTACHVTKKKNEKKKTQKAQAPLSQTLSVLENWLFQSADTRD